MQKVTSIGSNEQEFVESLYFFNLYSFYLLDCGCCSTFVRYVHYWLGFVPWKYKFLLKTIQLITKLLLLTQYHILQFSPQFDKMFRCYCYCQSLERLHCRLHLMHSGFISPNFLIYCLLPITPFLELPGR